LKPEYYDAVFSVSVFEHLAMPWKAVLEINRVMKPGGLLYISTHPTFPPHELPWDFWRFSPEAFKVLLNPHCGFEITECVEGNPARIISLAKDPATLKTFLSRVNQSIAVTATKKGEVDGRLNWGVGTEELLETMYPMNTK
jgi:SAM-dependent methyltransferase